MPNSKFISRLFTSILSHWPLQDVEELLNLHSLVNSTTSRRPAAARRALLNSATVLLAAHYEAFVESLFEQAAKAHYDALSDERLKSLYNSTSRRLNSASSQNVNSLFYNLGIPDVLFQIRFGGISNATIIAQLTELLNARHFIAHGSVRGGESKPRITKHRIARWVSIVRRTTKLLHQVVQDHVVKTSSD